MRYVCLLIVTLFPLLTNAQQQDVTGRWTGLLKQDGKAWSYVMTAEIRQTGQDISGMVKCIAPDGTYSLISIEGKKDGNKILFTDRAVMDETISTPQLRLCIKNYEGELNFSDNKVTIAGSWQNNGMKSFSNGRYFDGNFTCLPGFFSLERTAEPGDAVVQAGGNAASFLDRKIEVQKRFLVSADSLYLQFYDNGTVDNDTISVFLNKQPVVNKQRLTAAALRVPIKLEAGKDNEIIMFAENVGTIPPNTALLVFFDKEKRFEVIIDSDNGKNGTIVIRKQ